MKTYKLSATVRREVIDTILLEVRADDLETAKESASWVLEKFPEVADTANVTSCYVADREQQGVSILDLREREKHGK